MTPPICEVCNNEQKHYLHLSKPVFSCPNCGLQTSDAVFDISFKSQLDNEIRSIALKDLRTNNFERILSKLVAGTSSKQLKGLEIGTGNGWWLETCRRYGISCEGIEPEQSFRKEHERQHLPVYYDFYPSAQLANKKYDFIIFNDVLEHIPNPSKLFDSLRNNLEEKGLLIVNIPMSSGFFYRCAKLLYRFKMKSPMERMWQFDFHSPHINYFNSSNLREMFHQNGFSCTDEFKLQTLSYKSIKSRLKMDQGSSAGKITILSLFVNIGLALSKLFPPDIKVFFFTDSKTAK